MVYTYTFDEESDYQVKNEGIRRQEGKSKEKRVQNIIVLICCFVLFYSPYSLRSQVAMYTVFHEKSESEVEKCNLLEPGGKT